MGPSLPTPSPVPYQGFLPASLTSCWTWAWPLRSGGQDCPFSLPGVEGCQPRLLHTRTETVLGPVNLAEGGGRDWRLVRAGVGASEKEAPGHPLPQPHVLQP